MNIDELLSKHPIVPVLTENDPERALSVVRALEAGGIHCVELALRTPNALKVLEHLCRSASNVTVGAGTVRTPDDFEKVQRAGATFAVSPGSSEALAREANNWELAYLPAASTVSEIMQLNAWGYQTIKLFPAKQLGGVDYLRAISAPLTGVNFLPSGGVNQQSALEYLSLDCVNAVSGSWMIPADKVEAEDWQGITALSKECIRLLGKH